MCIALCPNMVQITMYFFLSRCLVTPRHRSVIMNKVVNESLRKICHYQQNVPQHYYLSRISSAVTLSSHVQGPLLNLNACVESKPETGFPGFEF